MPFTDTVKALLAAGAVIVFLLWSKSANASQGGTMYSKQRLTARQVEVADLIVNACQAAGVKPEFMLALAVTETRGSHSRPQAVGAGENRPSDTQGVRPRAT